MTKLTAVVDLQFGSTGKGLIAGYLSQKSEIDTVVSANMPNAGHTFVDKHGRKWINKVLPSGVYSPSTTYIGIGPGAVFDPERLVKEINEVRERVETDPQFLIHECAAILFPSHKAAEQKLNPIASTMQGSAEAVIQKMRRGGIDSNITGINPEHLAKYTTERGDKLSDFLTTNQQWFNIMLHSDHILVEGSQGYSLGINAGFYPYCTSRDCTVDRLMADCAMPYIPHRTVIGSARVHPIRVGHTNGGNSGPHYYDQSEISWDELGVPPETTTVTGRVRRVFTFSEIQIREAIFANGVDSVFLNFCNYDPQEAVRVSKIINKIGSEALKYRGLGNWESEFPQFVRYLGFGPKAEDIMEINGYSYGPF